MGGNFFTGYTPDMRFLPGSAQTWLDQLYMGGDYKKSKGVKFADTILKSAQQGDFTKNPFFGMRNAQLAGELRDIDTQPSFLLGPAGDRVREIRRDRAKERIGQQFGEDVAGSTFQAAGLSEQGASRKADEQYRRQFGALSLYPSLMYNASQRSQGFLGGLVNSAISGASQVGAGFAMGCDGRLKENVRDYEGGLAIVDALPIKQFEYNGLAGTEKGHKALGVIAQEARSIDPAIVVPYSGEYVGVDMQRLLFLALNAIQELSAEVRELKARIED